MIFSENRRSFWDEFITRPPNLPAKCDAERGSVLFPLLYHALNIRELAKAALILMQSREPYGVAILSRPALESAFNLMAAMNDVKFGPQRMAFEMEDLCPQTGFPHFQTRLAGLTQSDSGSSSRRRR